MTTSAGTVALICWTGNSLRVTWGLVNMVEPVLDLQDDSLTSDLVDCQPSFISFQKCFGAREFDSYLLGSVEDAIG